MRQHLWAEQTSQEPWRETLAPLVELLAGKRLAILTGAGCSTESGIPDYRGPETRHKTRNPIMYKEFVSDEANRARYWARSVIGWPRFLEARPNRAHEAIAAMERAGLVSGLITQNVDRLHHEAGSRRVVELHGALAEVRCLDCQILEDRSELQERLLALNPDAGLHQATAQGASSAQTIGSWEPSEQAVGPKKAPELAPDGDAEVPVERTRGFRVPPCLRCGGMLKPNVVFFGENVPRLTVEEAWQVIDDADALLVVGSSLAVYSGYRFVRGAEKREMPIAILNLGETRGDPHAHVRLDAKAGLIMPLLHQALAARM